ncbi:hypothetical protein KIW84_010947 [Lathyrus oleraceus]|uniref:Reverse transcriptase/retrotransposon-derived protein RNase H-like domain-containing protein n=1 Tax=Pisum sativum TaxID=3888 RepID=A0A9D4YPK8_PEA|nr:hypothetical protein KIW84_010947 [Pisum sativum]
MPLGLKNAGATYQRAMTTLFHDMMHKEIEVYVDDMIANERGIEVDPAKVKAIQEMLAPKTKKQVRAFDSIKEYLSEPPILSPPVEGRPLIMYLTVLEDSMGCVLGQQDESGKKEYVIYYLSKKFTDCESRYSMLEKTCSALAWAANRLR